MRSTRLNSMADMVVDKKTKAWVDEQNKLNKQERQNYGTKYIEDTDQTYPMQYARTQSPNLKRGGSEPNLPRKQNMVPQPTWALTEFVKHVADPLVDKGWNLHLKFGKGEPQKEEFIQGTTTRPQLRLWTRRKFTVFQGKSKLH